MARVLVLTVIGEDRPGLVEALAQLISEHEGSWHESRMARLAGHFAGVVQVHLPERNGTGRTGAAGERHQQRFGARRCRPPSHPSARADRSGSSWNRSGDLERSFGVGRQRPGSSHGRGERGHVGRASISRTS